MTSEVSSELLGTLREDFVRFKGSRVDQEVAAPQAAVLARFQPIFSPEHISTITADEFRSFLLIENNRHWTGLHRQGSRMCADMDKLRGALRLLIDEEQDISDRLDEAIEMVHGMGKNIATAILLIAYPQKYGVWNNRSEGALKRLRIWPEFDRGESFGHRYARINHILLQLRDALGTDLWTLDSLWWFLDQEQDAPTDVDEPVSEHAASSLSVATPLGQRFGLERHLHVFLRDNWNNLELAPDWSIFAEPGDEEAGYEYPTEVGKIDLLAKHKREPRWLVIELKRESSTDQTVGQILRYMGWVKKHLAKPDDLIEGMIISRDTDKRLPYALDMIQGVELRTYEVHFNLKKPAF